MVKSFAVFFFFEGFSKTKMGTIHILFIYYSKSNIQYSIIFKNWIYSVFGIQTFLKNRIYLVFSIRSISTICDNTGSHLSKALDFINTRTSGRSTPLVLVPVSFYVNRKPQANDIYKIVNHTEVGIVTNLEECDWHWGVWLTLRSVTNIEECDYNIEVCF